jgi:hypothetical protein
MVIISIKNEIGKKKKNDHSNWTRKSEGKPDSLDIFRHHQLLLNHTCVDKLDDEKIGE